MGKYNILSNNLYMLAYYYQRKYIQTISNKFEYKIKKMVVLPTTKCVQIKYLRYLPYVHVCIKLVLNQVPDAIHNHLSPKCLFVAKKKTKYITKIKKIKIKINRKKSQQITSESHVSFYTSHKDKTIIKL